MRLVVPWLLYGLIVLPYSSSIPFARAAKRKDGEDSANSVRGAATKVTKSVDELTPSPIVEAFFQEPTGDAAVSRSLKDAIRTMANTEEMQNFLQSVRRSLHRHPELMYELPFTSETIQGILDELKIDYTTGWAKNTHPDIYPGTGGYGIVAHIGSRDVDKPCIILRADMDALPIVEATKGIVESFKSSTPGKMHACGHDGHVTMLLGAAALLKSVENEIEGTIRLVFQPAEEGGAGMKRMVEEGIVELEPKAQNAFGMHVWPT